MNTHIYDNMSVHITAHEITTDDLTTDYSTPDDITPNDIICISRSHFPPSLTLSLPLTLPILCERESSGCSADRPPLGR